MLIGQSRLNHYRPAIASLPPLRSEEKTEDYLRDRHKETYDKANWYRRLYYTVSALAAVGAAVLPFIIPFSQLLGTIVAVVVALAIAFDKVFAPLDKWKQYSVASDRIFVEQAIARGEYDRHKEVIDAIVRAEAAQFNGLKSASELANSGEKNRQRQRASDEPAKHPPSNRT